MIQTLRMTTIKTQIKAAKKALNYHVNQAATQPKVRYNEMLHGQNEKLEYY
jgi:hypothetical protein